jgi:hypothetical protein
MKEDGEPGETVKVANPRKHGKNEKPGNLSVTNGLSLNLNLKKNELLNIII